jgi:hypothetical protein
VSEPDTSTDPSAAAGPSAGSPAWAADLAARLLVGLPKKWAHTQEVARHARWAAAGVDPGERDLLVAAAYLHDIGYAAPIVDTGFHPLDGARYLSDLGLFELACQVAHHSGAAIEADFRGLAAELAEFPRPTDAVADAVTYADVTSGPTGHAMEPGDRFAEIVQRHGEDSIVAAARSQARAQMYAAVGRTLRRATAARPLPSPLVVTPVELGCSTLLRFHGSLDRTTADHGEEALRTVLASRAHAVVCDLSLITGMDSTAAERRGGGGGGPRPPPPPPPPPRGPRPPPTPTSGSASTGTRR